MATHRRVRLSAIVIAVVAGLLTPALMAAVPASAQTGVSLPADESPHPSDSTEWWYFTGHLTGTDLLGHTHQYGFEQNFIRFSQNIEPLAAYNGQFAITDLTRGTFKQNLAAFSVQPDNVVPGGGYNNTVDGWNMNGKNGQNNISAAFADGSYAMDLSLNQSTPAALWGNDGVIPYTPFGTSDYYSEPALKVSGTVIDHGIPITVTGTAWMDHQWGNFAGTGGWTWFSWQLTNGTQYMLYFLNDSSGNPVETIGGKVSPNGTVTMLDPSQISETPLGSWTSPNTGITYPQNWLVKVPGGQVTVTVLEANQELYLPIVNHGYWEGDSSLSGTINGVPVSGQGYSEITPSFTFPLSLTGFL